MNTPQMKIMYWKAMKTAAKTLYQNPQLVAGMEQRARGVFLDALTNHIVGMQLAQGLENMLVMHHEGVDIYA